MMKELKTTYTSILLTNKKCLVKLGSIEWKSETENWRSFKRPLAFLFNMPNLKYSINYISKKCLVKLGLRVCPREHQAVLPHAISPISLKPCQFKGFTPKLKKTNWFPFWFFSGGGGIDHPRIFMVFTKETASKYVKSMKLSLRWYLTDYTESLYTCYYILVNIRRKYQLIWLTVCQSMEANKWLCFQTFRVFQFSEFFRVF